MSYVACFTSVGTSHDMRKWFQRGTLAYMAPELCGMYEDGATSSNSSSSSTGKVPVTQAVDVYSFGVLMWEVLSGERPQRCHGRVRNLRHVSAPLQTPAHVEYHPILWFRAHQHLTMQLHSRLSSQTHSSSRDFMCNVWQAILKLCCHAFLGCL